MHIWNLPISSIGLAIFMIDKVYSYIHIMKSTYLKIVLLKIQISFLKII